MSSIYGVHSKSLLAAIILNTSGSKAKPNTRELQKRVGAPSKSHSRSATAGVCIQVTLIRSTDILL